MFKYTLSTTTTYFHYWLICWLFCWLIVFFYIRKQWKMQVIAKQCVQIVCLFKQQSKEKKNPTHTYIYKIMLECFFCWWTNGLILACLIADILFFASQLCFWLTILTYLITITVSLHTWLIQPTEVKRKSDNSLMNWLFKIEHAFNSSIKYCWDGAGVSYWNKISCSQLAKCTGSHMNHDASFVSSVSEKAEEPVNGLNSKPGQL